MRRPFVGRQITRLVRRARCQSFAEAVELLAQAPEFIAELEHRLVLLGQVPFEVRDLLFQPLNTFVHASAGGFNTERAFSSSGITTR